jgi:hypothetical protein
MWLEVLLWCAVVRMAGACLNTDDDATRPKEDCLGGTKVSL